MTKVLHFVTLERKKESEVAQLCLPLCNPMDCSTPGFPLYLQLPELAQTHAHRVSNTIQPSHPLSSPSPTFDLFLASRVFSNKSVLHIRWPKYWNFSFLVTTLVLDLKMVKVWRVSCVCLEAWFLCFVFSLLVLFIFIDPLAENQGILKLLLLCKILIFSSVSCPCYPQVLDLLNG